MGNLIFRICQTHLLEPDCSTSGREGVFGIANAVQHTQGNIRILRNVFQRIQGTRNVRLPVDPNLYITPGFHVAVVPPALGDAEKDAAAAADVVRGPGEILCTVIGHGPTGISNGHHSVVSFRDAGFRSGVQIGIALAVKLGKPLHHLLPGTSLLGRNLIGTHELRMGACFGAEPVQVERNGSNLCNIRIRNGVVPLLGEGVIFLTGNGVGLQVLELPHSAGKGRTAVILGGCRIVVALQVEFSFCRVCFVNGDRDGGNGFAALFRQLDFPDDRMLHVVGTAVLVIDVHIELQILGRDVLREAGQSLRLGPVRLVQLVIGARGGGVHGYLLIIDDVVIFVLHRHHQLHLDGDAPDVREIGGSMPEFGDIDLRLFPVGVGNRAAIGGTLD